MSNWEEIWEYVMQHKDQVHVFGSKELGWIRVSWAGNGAMIYKSIHTMERAKEVISKALMFSK